MSSSYTSFQSQGPTSSAFNHIIPLDFAIEPASSEFKTSEEAPTFPITEQEDEEFEGLSSDKFDVLLEDILGKDFFAAPAPDYVPKTIVVPLSECFVEVPSWFPEDASVDHKFDWLKQRKNTSLQLHNADPYFFNKNSGAGNFNISKKLALIALLSNCFSSLIGSYKCWFGFHKINGPNRSTVTKDFLGIQIIYFSVDELNAFVTLESMIPFLAQNIFDRFCELQLGFTLDQIKSSLLIHERKIVIADTRERASRASKPVVRFEPEIKITKERKRKIIAIPDEEFGAETDEETFVSAVEKLKRVDVVASVQIDKAMEKEISDIPSYIPAASIYAPSPEPELPPIYGLVGIPHFDAYVSGGLDIVAPKAKKARVAPSGSGVRREAILSTLMPKTLWVNSIEGEVWISAWKIYFCARSSYSTSKEIIEMHKSNKSLGFEIARTTEIIQHIISKTKEDDLIVHGIMLAMFFKMIYCLDLQPASCPTDAYVSPLVNSRKLGSDRRPSDSLKPMKEKCFGLALPRSNVNKRSKHDTDMHAEELNFLICAINSTLEITLPSGMVPAQHNVISTITAILSKYQPSQLKPFGYCVGSCWTYLPAECDINVWGDIQYIGKIVAVYATCVRKGAVMGTIVGDLGYQIGQFLPPFMGPESDYVGDSARGDAALNKVMYGDQAPPPPEQDFVQMFEHQQEINI